MPRKPRRESESGVYHFIVRGVNKKKLFHRPEDYEFYRALLVEYKTALGIEIYHYCLMNNHVHLVLKAPDLSTLSRFGHFTQRRHAYYYCKTYRWAEQVFRKRFLSLPIENDAYLLECGRYVERNPLEAKLIDRIEDYPYTSLPFYIAGKADALVSESPAFLSLSVDERERRRIYRFYVLQERIKEEGFLEPF
jgi:putative transposase